MRLLAWLMGVRIVERGPAFIVVKIPRWMGADRMTEKLQRELVPDAALVGKRVRVTRGARCVRLDVEEATR